MFPSRALAGCTVDCGLQGQNVGQVYEMRDVIKENPDETVGGGHGIEFIHFTGFLQPDCAILANF